MAFCFEVPEYERAARAFVGETMEALARVKSPLLSEIERETADHLPGMRMTFDSDEVLEHQPMRIGTSISIPVSATIEGDYQDFYAALDDAAEEYAGGLTRQIYERMSEITDAAGTTVSAGGSFTVAHFLEVMERIEIEFDDEGNPQLPKLHIHPTQAEKLPEWTEEDHRAFEELIARKKQEWDARRRHRRLPRQPE